MPPRYLLSLSEAAARWSVSSFDVVTWALEELLALSIAPPPVRIGPTEFLSGLVDVEPTHVLPLFRREAPTQTVPIRCVKDRDGELRWVAPRLSASSRSIASSKGINRLGQRRHVLPAVGGQDRAFRPVMTGIHSTPCSCAASTSMACRPLRPSWCGKCVTGLSVGTTNRHQTRAPSPERSGSCGRSCTGPSSALFLINDGADHLDVHREVADPGNLGSDVRPVHEPSSVTGEPRAGSETLRVVVCGRRIPREEPSGVIPAEQTQRASPPPAISRSPKA